jgi:hypothetical protein
MRIRSQKDIDTLELTIKEELGIDIQKYRNEEIVENFVELLVFPQYVFNWVLRPIGISLLIFFVGFFVFDLGGFEYIVYGLLGFALFFVGGVLFGLLFLMWKMKNDIWGILEYSLEIMDSAVEDLKATADQMNPGNRKNVLGLLFKGVIHVVTIPMLSRVISEKVPFVGGIVNTLIKRVLSIISDRVNFEEDQIKAELSKTEEEPKIFEIYSKALSSVSGGLEKVMNVTFGIAQLPLKIVFGIILLILLILLYILN